MYSVHVCIMFSPFSPLSSLSLFPISLLSLSLPLFLPFITLSLYFSLLSPPLLSFFSLFPPLSCSLNIFSVFISFHSSFICLYLSLFVFPISPHFSRPPIRNAFSMNKSNESRLLLAQLPPPSSMVTSSIKCKTIVSFSRHQPLSKP